MFNGFVLGIVFVIAVGLAGGYVVLRQGYVPANADATPGPLETWAAGMSLQAAMDRLRPNRPTPSQRRMKT